MKNSKKKVEERKLTLEGGFTITPGIPQGVYTEAELSDLQAKNPEKDLAKYINATCGPLLKNRIVTVGKQELLNVAFETGGGVVFNFMAVGDGGYDFGLDARKFPQNSDTALFHQVGNAQEILSFGAVTGDPIVGFTKVLSSTFFSEDYAESDFLTQNQDDFFLNEVSVQTENAVMFSHITFPNFPFNPADQLALTIQWYIRIL